ncbi:hypothetical protein F66182_3820 [Fusarium sp. NRRL 66182]|nr:hypothetical protein F66182_3820 [Fusarium sp. NRRL 66182]
MSDPINIPTKRPYRQYGASDLSPFAENEGPYMVYTEVHENGRVYHAVSSGSGKFISVGPRCKLPFVSFSVEKDRVNNATTISFSGRSLRHTISRVIEDTIVPPVKLTLDLNTVLKHYDALRLEYDSLLLHAPHHDATEEMRLLLDDTLLERSLYDGVQVDLLRQQGIIGISLFQDIHQRNMDLGICDLEDCFRIGQYTKEQATECLESQNNRISELALQGRLDDLRTFCEPLIRSREIKVLYNSDLLLCLLDNKLIHVYEYILDLIERTQPISMDLPSTDCPDITFNPLCVAIRLGHYRTVQYLIGDNDTFVGYIAEDIADGTGRAFTPLVAAVFWQRVDIIQLLLESGPMYHTSLFEADQLALEMGLLDVS